MPETPTTKGIDLVQSALTDSEQKRIISIYLNTNHQSDATDWDGAARYFGVTSTKKFKETTKKLQEKIDGLKAGGNTASPASTSDSSDPSASPAAAANESKKRKANGKKCTGPRKAPKRSAHKRNVQVEDTESDLSFGGLFD